MNRLLASLLGLLLTPLLAAAQSPAAPPAGPAIEKGSSVQIEYTLKEEDGRVIDTSQGRGPVRFTQGQEELLPGLERALIGLRPGDQKRVVLRPEDGYGPLDPSAVTEVPKTMLPPESLKVGTMVMARGQQGESRPVWVKQIKDSSVVLDLNHPLAGKTLVFDVRVVTVTAPGR